MAQSLHRDPDSDPLQRPLAVEERHLHVAVGMEVMFATLAPTSQMPKKLGDLLRGMSLE